MSEEKRSYQYAGGVGAGGGGDEVPIPPQNPSDVTNGAGLQYSLSQLQSFIPPGTQLSVKPPNIQFPPPPPGSGITPYSSTGTGVTPYSSRNYSRNPGCLFTWTFVVLKTSGGPTTPFPFWLITINPFFVFGFVWVLLPIGIAVPISIAVPLNNLLSLNCPF